MNRAYSLITIKAVNDEAREIEGIATTPEVDRMGDIVDPLGAQFTNPSPLLWQHNHDEPVGQATFGKPTKDGIPFKAKIAKSTGDSVTLRERLDEAWESIKIGLVRAVSIGFRSLEHSYMDGGGIRFNAIEVLELSLVTIPANQSASITAIKSIDTQQRAASGRELQGSKAVAKTPGVTGAVSLKPTKGSAPMTIKEQIAALEAKRAASSARMSEIMTKTGEAGRSTDEKEREEFDTLRAEVETVDGDLERMRALDKINATKAAPVTPAAGTEHEVSVRTRTGHVEVRPNQPKGTGFVRYAMCLAQAKGNLMHAHEIAKRLRDTNPEIERVLKAAVDAGTTTDTTWAAPLVDYQTLANEFIELLRPATIIGRLPSLRRVPFNVRMPKQTAGGTYQWVGEGAPKPVGDLAFSEVTMRWAKASGIIVISEELARFSNPAAESIVRQDLIAGIAAFLDAQFVDPTVAAVANVSPASITNAITPIQASGTDSAAVRTDVGGMFAVMLGANISPSTGAWIMTPVTAMRLSLMQNPLGQPEYPGITPTGGTWLGYPVITSESVPEGSDGGLIIFVNQADVFLAEEGLMIDVSREASLQFNTAPDNPATASTVFKSLWQQDLIGLRAHRFVNWLRRRDESVGVIESVAYGT